MWAGRISQNHNGRVKGEKVEEKSYGYATTQWNLWVFTPLSRHGPLAIEKDAVDRRLS